MLDYDQLEMLSFEKNQISLVPSGFGTGGDGTERLVLGMRRIPESIRLEISKVRDRGD